MPSEPPSFYPRPPSSPPEPGTAAYRSSSAPTTSVAPPPLSPSGSWSVARALLAASMLVVRGAVVAGSGALARHTVTDVVTSTLVALLLASVPLLLPRYRSFGSFSWCLLIVSFVELYAAYSRAIG